MNPASELSESPKQFLHQNFRYSYTPNWAVRVPTESSQVATGKDLRVALLFDRPATPSLRPVPVPNISILPAHRLVSVHSLMWADGLRFLRLMTENKAEAIIMGYGD